MPAKTRGQKLDKPLLVSLGAALFDELQGIAKENKTSAQDLLRRAAEAIVRCRHEHGEVPMDMELYQRRIGSHREEFVLNEEQAKMLTALKERAKDPDHGTEAGQKASRAGRK